MLRSKSNIGQCECVSDLGVTRHNGLGFTEHIAKTARKAHQRCFTSKIAIRVLHNLRSPHAGIQQPTVVTGTQKDIILLESIQKRFTKRIPGLATILG